MMNHSSIVLTGSLAYDHIMTFPDYFKNHIAPEKIPVLSVSFLVDSFKRHFGGTAGNVAYTMRLLGMHPQILATVGKDFSDYAAWLRSNTIATESLVVCDALVTGQAFIITDRDNSQITAFHPGSMNEAQRCSLAAITPKPAFVVISANGTVGMNQYVQECKKLQIPYLYDPGQAIPAISDLELKDGILHASIIAMNEYELHMVTERIGLTLEDICGKCETVVVTAGSNGSTIFTGGTTIKIPIAYARELKDPTGCGDAHRAGMLFGMQHQLPWEVVGRIAALAATFCIEHEGTQNHHFTWEEFLTRYQEAFGTALHLPHR